MYMAVFAYVGSRVGSLLVQCMPDSCFASAGRRWMAVRQTCTAMHRTF